MEDSRYPVVKLQHMLCPDTLPDWLALLSTCGIAFKEEERNLALFSKLDADKLIWSCSPRGSVAAQCSQLFAAQIEGLSSGASAACRAGLLNCTMLSQPWLLKRSKNSISLRLGYTSTGSEVRLTLKAEKRKRGYIAPEMRGFIVPDDDDDDDESSADRGSESGDADENTGLIAADGNNNDELDPGSGDDDDDPGPQSPLRDRRWSALWAALRDCSCYSVGVLQLIDELGSPHTRAGLLDPCSRRIVLQGAQAAFWWAAEQAWWTQYLHNNPVRDLISVEGEIVAMLGSRSPTDHGVLWPLLSPFLPGARFSMDLSAGESLLLDLGGCLVTTVRWHELRVTL